MGCGILLHPFPGYVVPSVRLAIQVDDLVVPEALLKGVERESVFSYCVILVLWFESAFSLSSGYRYSLRFTPLYDQVFSAGFQSMAQR